ncbi:MAG: hypothetical protein GQ552_02055 [Flavobacteriaceae bacterium]|nr:hypothetical protein [Flavobacteriaceae bacterium]
MKKSNLFILAFTLFAMNLSAAVLNPIKPTDKLRAEIINYIGTNCPYDYNKNECTAEVLFTVNSKSEIIILSVISPNPKAESYLKSKLNYKKVSQETKREGEVYLLPLRMVRE